jgi:hypothetical protein
MTDYPEFITRQTELHEAMTSDAQALGLDITYGLCDLCAQAEARPRFIVEKMASPAEWEDTATCYRVFPN